MKRIQSHRNNIWLIPLQKRFFLACRYFFISKITFFLKTTPFSSILSWNSFLHFRTHCKTTNDWCLDLKKRRVSPTTDRWVDWYQSLATLEKVAVFGYWSLFVSWTVSIFGFHSVFPKASVSFDNISKYSTRWPRKQTKLINWPNWLLHQFSLDIHHRQVQKHILYQDFLFLLDHLLAHQTFRVLLALVSVFQSDFWSIFCWSFPVWQGSLVIVCYNSKNAW